MKRALTDHLIHAPSILNKYMRKPSASHIFEH